MASPTPGCARIDRTRIEARGGDLCDMLDFAARETNIVELPTGEAIQRVLQPRALLALLKALSVPAEQAPGALCPP